MPCETASERFSAAGPWGMVCLRSVVRPLASLIGVVIILWGMAPPAPGQAVTLPDVPRSFYAVRPAGWALDAMDITAYEDNVHFTYVMSTVAKRDKRGQADSGEKQAARLVRRFFFLKPGAYIFDDQLIGVDANVPLKWSVEMNGRRQVIDVIAGPAPIVDNKARTVYRTLIPPDLTTQTVRRQNDQPGATELVARVVPGKVRIVHMIGTWPAGREWNEDDAVTGSGGDGRELEVLVDNRKFQLTLPSLEADKSYIKVSGLGGETLLARRILPAGIMPHGPEGVAMLERWDSAYRRDGRPGWDTGRVSSNLQKVVEAGTIAPCRAVVLGCGTGTNAIFLAKRGFDVVGIDVAPTALKLAEEKAEKAGVKVRWLLADVTAPPELERFDFVFDRGCYHGVRRQNAAGYVRSLVGLARPGARVLILAGNANEERHYGPPRVKEEEIREDFSEQFDFQWLRETNFDTKTPGNKGALAWSIMLRKKE